MTLCCLDHSVIFGIMNKQLRKPRHTTHNKGIDPHPLHISSVVLYIRVLVFSCSFCCFGFVILLHCFAVYIFSQGPNKKEKVGRGRGTNYLNSIVIHIRKKSGSRCSRSYVSFFIFAKAYICRAPSQRKERQI
jgi:hypothetical protein